MKEGIGVQVIVVHSIVTFSAAGETHWGWKIAGGGAVLAVGSVLVHSTSVLVAIETTVVVEVGRP